MRSKPKPSERKPAEKTNERRDYIRSSFPCDICQFVARSDRDLGNHLEEVHRFARINRQQEGVSRTERRNNGFCV